MEKFFIAWGGNDILAQNLAKKINEETENRAIVGGGNNHNHWHIGTQVKEQMNKCSSAIILIEDKNNSNISNNLMFEWGYLFSHLKPTDIYPILVNTDPKNLPTDLIGAWSTNVTDDRTTNSDEEVADIVFDAFLDNLNYYKDVNYFDLINIWRKIFSKLSDYATIPDNVLCQYLIAGCLAAYYYEDYPSLKIELDKINCSNEFKDVLAFAKSYIDVFLESQNMLHPISQNSFFSLINRFEATLSRKRRWGKDEEMLIDTLCYNVYGLACLLFLKNNDLDNETVEYFSSKSLECFTKMSEFIDKFEEKHENNECLVQLLRAYVYNDTAHLYKDYLNDQDKFLEYLTKSVNERNALHQTFIKNYIDNPFLAIKLEQEYIIALSEQCIYIKNPVQKRIDQSVAKAKVAEWERELMVTSSLTERIRANIEKF